MPPSPFLSGDHPAALLALEHGALVLAGLLVYLLLTRIGNQRRTPTSAIAWILVIGIFPYIGLPLFLLFGTRKFARPLRQTRESPIRHLSREEPLWVTRLLAAMQLPPPTHNLSIRFHKDGRESREALFELIESAQSQIDLCSFILGADELGKQLVSALVRASQRGVRVRVLLDAIGALYHPRLHHARLRRAGVAVRYFMPLLHNPFKGRSNLRNHRKLVAADTGRMWCGGRNFASEYFTGTRRRHAWVDLSFEVNGPLAAQAAILFERDWQGYHGMADSRPALPAVSDTLQGSRAQLVPSGPDLADDTLYDLLLTAAYQAKQRLVAVTPYFVPDDALLSAWCMACRRGVDFTLLIPARSNHFLADLAREPALRELAQAGARIFLFPEMIHAKALCVDDELALCGSANLDGRSLFLNFELMAAFYDTREISWLREWSASLMSQASPYQPQAPGLGRGLAEGLARTVGFQL